MGMRYPGVAAGLLQAGGPKLTSRTEPKGGVIEHNQLRIGAVIQHPRPLGISLSARASVDAQQLRNPPRRLLFLGALGGKWKRHPGGIRVVEARVFGADLSLRALLTRLGYRLAEFRKLRAPFPSAQYPSVPTHESTCVASQRFIAHQPQSRHRQSAASQTPGNLGYLCGISCAQIAGITGLAASV